MLASIPIFYPQVTLHLKGRDLLQPIEMPSRSALVNHCEDLLLTKMLGGGFKDILSSPQNLGDMIHFDEHVLSNVLIRTTN